VDVNLNKSILPNLALVLIDMQDSFIHIEERKIIPNQIAILRLCKRNHVPVVIVEYIAEGRTVPRLLRETQKIPSDSLYKIIKEYDSAFVKTKLEEILESLSAQYLLITGVKACACVHQTVSDAVAKGFKIISASDLIAGYCNNCSPKREESWYKSTVIYFDNHKQILRQVTS